MNQAGTAEIPVLVTPEAEALVALVAAQERAPNKRNCIFYFFSSVLYFLFYSKFFKSASLGTIRGDDYEKDCQFIGCCIGKG